MGAVVWIMIAVFSVAARVSAQTYHVVGGWGPDLDVNSWVSGRVFRVGDKIMFKNSDSRSVVEVAGEAELAACNLTNPIRMYTDRDTHVALDKEGVRYFASSDMQSCKKGLRLLVPVHPHPPHEYDIPSPPRAYPDPQPHPAAAASVAVPFVHMVVAVMAHLMGI